MDLLKAEIFTPFANVDAWFTLKNEQVVNTDGSIPGLNLGLNTISEKSEVEENRNRLFDQLDLDKGSVALAGQVHGDHIEVVREGGYYPETDAMITESQNLILAIQVADCAAVLLADPDSDIIGAAHAGWRGAVRQIVPKTIDKMKEVGSARPDRMIAYVSPAICQKHFEVGEEVAIQFADHFVDYRNYEKPHVDLKGVIKQQLMDAGLRERQIQLEGFCTFGEKDKFYSYRREGEKAGRMFGLIQLK